MSRSVTGSLDEAWFDGVTIVRNGISDQVIHKTALNDSIPYDPLGTTRFIVRVEVLVCGEYTS